MSSYAQLFWVQISFVLLFTSMFGLLARRALKRLEKYPSTPEWLVSLCETAHVPVAWLIWGYGILVSIKIASAHVEIYIPADLIFNVGNIFFVLTLTWTLFKWKSRYESIIKSRILVKQGTDKDVLIFALGRVFSIIMITLASLIILEIVGIPLTALLTFGGLGGIAIGLAAKDIVVNFLGGLMLHINRPFIVGDTISSPNKNFEGVVEQIGWHSTQIRTLERRPMFIPNSIISDAIIENAGRMYNRRIKEVIGIRFEDNEKIDLITSQIEKMLKADQDIDQEQTILVDLVSLGESALNIEIYCFTKTVLLKEWRQIRQRIFLKIIEIVSQNEAQIPYPITTVKLLKEQ